MPSFVVEPSGVELTGRTAVPTLTGILVSSETVMDTTAAPRRTDGLHVAAPDGCTLAESTAFQGF